MKRQMTALALILAALLQTNPTYAEIQGNTAVFKDTEKHWGKTYIEKLQKEGYAVGSNGYFKPNEALKTEDFLIMALKVVDPSAKDLTAAQGQKYYEPFMARAVEVGLIRNEYDEVPQYVERMMPRELAVQVIDRAITLMGETVTVDHGLENKFKDYEIINDINKDAVLRSYQLGIIKGTNGYFGPKNPLTRAEAAVLIAKLMDKSLRDTVTVSKNKSIYDQVTEWYLNEFGKQVEKRTVVIEKKPGGLMNSGDVDYTEKAFYLNGNWNNWWTDQEFEDFVLNEALGSKIRTSSQIGLPDNFDTKDLTRVGGTYIPYNGELMFVREDDQNDGIARKHYEVPTRNLNRLVYDLSKYGTQYAMLQTKANKQPYDDWYCYYNLFVNDQHFAAGVAYSPNINTIEGSFRIFKNPTEFAKIAEMTFSPDVSFSVPDYSLLEKHEAYFKQCFTRLYGADGDYIYANVKAWMKGRSKDTYSKDVVKTIKGIKICYSDVDGIGPEVLMTLKK